ncbi:unnamed protein product [Bursaphelenchus okinawaensis]|uniref:Serine/threonine-protein phosphatase n=1 Tax=Bursaphelenchus okinawaensis TaxID=465554 RepID=A0A811LSU2_9BILA|nr:unnamed protein product [Bursaphelenchus okinawaensis]CAG9127917.1 unnamed protein product [Bursaphelenchus okinawaensis]
MASKKDLKKLSFREKADILDPPTKDVSSSSDGKETKDPPKVSTDKTQKEDNGVEPSAANTRLSKMFSGVKAEKPLNLKNLIKDHLMAGAKRMDYEPTIIYQLLELAKDSFQKQEPLIELNAPVNICGDIHGQYSDLLRIFNSCGMPFKVRYLFLGDYIDRGKHSIEVIMLLLACKVKYPKNIYLLRGNHELKNINKVYGFFEAIKKRYNSDTQLVDDLYLFFNEVFSFMPYAALVSRKILCMHGGISPRLNSLDDIRKLKRGRLVMEKNTLEQDLLWSDPQKGVKGYEQNKIRSVSVLFGEEAVKETLARLKIDMVIRAHQVVEFGYAFFANRSVITVFSAARYTEDLCNYAAVVQISSKLECSFTQLKPIEFDEKKREKQIVRTMDCDDEE